MQGTVNRASIDQVAAPVDPDGGSAHGLGQVTGARIIGNHQPGAGKQTCQPVERQFTTTILCGPLHGLEDGIDRRLFILNPNHDDMVTLTLQGITYGCKFLGGPPPAWIGGTGMQDNDPTPPFLALARTPPPGPEG